MVTVMGKYTLVLAAPLEETVTNVMGGLNHGSYRAVTSFDLTNALGAGSIGAACPCHGPEACTCRYPVVLLNAFLDLATT